MTLLPSQLRHARAFTLILLLAATASCSSTTTPGTGPTVASLSGSYTATVYRVTPPGLVQIDALAAGGSIAITIALTGTTSGSLSLPASVTGGAGFSANMAGTVTIAGNTVQFVQLADSFFRNLVFTVSGSALTVVNGTAGGATYTITLSRT